MKIKSFFLFPLLIAYGIICIHLASYLEQRPVAVKLGYTPSAAVLKLVSGDQRYALAEWNILKVIFYFGSLIDKQPGDLSGPPEYYNMFKTIETAIELDPYNIDAYYFAQAAFTWGVGRARDVNRLLAYGMRYRTWDYYLPYFAGFNASYFLKKPEEAAVYYKKAAELSGKAFFASLAARYLYEADQTPIAISFLSMMIEKSTDTSEKAIYTKRLEALKAAQVILKGVEQYENRYGRRPKTLQEVVASSILSDIPVDPYGGTFYLDEKGKVRTTSQLAPVNSGQNYSPIIRP